MPPVARGLDARESISHDLPLAHCLAAVLSGSHWVNTHLFLPDNGCVSVLVNMERDLWLRDVSSALADFLSVFLDGLCCSYRLLGEGFLASTSQGEMLRAGHGMCPIAEAPTVHRRDGNE